jgi:hypothetical protein
MLLKSTNFELGKDFSYGAWKFKVHLNIQQLMSSNPVSNVDKIVYFMEILFSFKSVIIFESNDEV